MRKPHKKRQPGKRKLDRLRALARPAPLGYKVCARCLKILPLIAYKTRFGTVATRCAPCRAYCAAATLRHMRTYSRTPHGRKNIYKVHCDFIDARPWHNRLYKIRYMIDKTWAKLKPEAQLYLLNLGYKPGKTCEVCGKSNPVAFWPDYRTPWVWMRLCPLHRKDASAADKRTLNEMAEQIASAQPQMLEILTLLRTNQNEFTSEG